MRDTEEKRSSVLLTGKREEGSSTGGSGIGDTSPSVGLPSVKVRSGGQGGKQEDTSYLAEAGVRNAVRKVEGSKARLLVLCYSVSWQLETPQWLFDKQYPSPFSKV